MRVSPVRDGRRSAAESPERVQVIATTEEGTCAALVEASNLVHRSSGDRLVLLVPRSNSLVATMQGFATEDRPINGYRRLARRAKVTVLVRLCLCGSYDEAIRWLLPADSVVVVGGRRRWWWPTPEERFAERLRRIGYQTIFADVSRPAPE